MKDTNSFEYKMREQKLDTTKDQLAMRIGYAVITFFSLLERYRKEENEFNKWVKEEK